MIFNICGPPASSKSTLIERFISEEPEYKHVSIDNFRRTYKDENVAWTRLYCSLLENKYSLLESSGISYHIRDIESDLEIQEKGFATIVLYGNNEHFLERLKTRKKEHVPFFYRQLSQEGLIKVASERLPKLFPEAYFLQSDNDVNQEFVYEMFSQWIYAMHGVFEMQNKIGETK